MNPRTKPYSFRFHEPRSFKGSFLILSVVKKLLIVMV